MKPLIGLVPLMDYKLESYWMLPGYMDGVTEAGGLPIMLPPTDDPAEIEQLVRTCDGIVITGGQDVDPALYGEERKPTCKELAPERDRMEPTLIAEALRQDKAILGICRGIQALNVALGGTLYQDLPTEHPSEITHSMDAPYDRAEHTVDVIDGTPLAKVLGAGELGVNSYHHQAIHDLAEPLRPMALAPDGLIEAVWDPSHHFVWAVQWHPEFFHKKDQASRDIFAAFVNGCERG